MGTAYNISSSPSIIFYLPTFILDLLQPMLSEKFRELAFHPDSPQQLRDECLVQSNKNQMHVCKAFYRQAVWCDDIEIESVNCSVLILQGANDQITPVESAQLLHEKLKNCKIEIIEKAGHQVPILFYCYFYSFMELFPILFLFLHCIIGDARAARYCW